MKMKLPLQWHNVTVESWHDKTNPQIIIPSRDVENDKIHSSLSKASIAFDKEQGSSNIGLITQPIVLIALLAQQTWSCNHHKIWSQTWPCMTYYIGYTGCQCGLPTCHPRYLPINLLHRPCLNQDDLPNSLYGVRMLHYLGPFILSKVNGHKVTWPIQKNS